MNYWERWTQGEKLVVVLFATGLVAFVVSTAVRSLPQRPPEIKFYDAPQSPAAATTPLVTTPVQQQSVPQTPAVRTTAPAIQSSPNRQPSAVAAATPAQVPQQQTPAQAPPAGPIDINTADAAQLDKLPGVGPVLAQRIVEYRQKVGRFTSVDQLREVKGIGPKKLEQIRPLVTL